MCRPRRSRSRKKSEEEERESSESILHQQPSKAEERISSAGKKAEDKPLHAPEHPSWAAPIPAPGTRRSPREQAAIDYSHAFAAQEESASHPHLHPRVLLQLHPAPASAIVVPRTYAEAMSSPQCEQWKAAMVDELRSMRRMDVYEEVPLEVVLREGGKLIACQWIYTVKLGKDGEVLKFKARLVAKGYTQREGIDYNETFAPVMKYLSLRVLLTIAASLGWSIYQMDVDTAFLNAPSEAAELYPEAAWTSVGAGWKRRSGSDGYCTVLLEVTQSIVWDQAGTI